MHGQAKAVLRGVFVHLAELCRRGAALVSAYSDSGDAAVLEANGLVDHASGLIDPEMADGIEDPVQGHAKVAFAEFASAFCAFKERGKLLSAPLHHTDGDVDLSMNNALRMQLLHHAIRH